MTYLRNCWYVAAYTEEVGRQPIARTLLDEQVVLYRTEGGTPAALKDECVHRFAPLHRGRVVGETLQCPYHGLRFDVTGGCVAVPAAGEVPPRARVKHYPLVERYAMLWIWMGDPARADPASIPDFSRLEQDGTDWWTGYLHARGNYQLLVDNLMDLSHVQFIHPAFASDAWLARATHTLEQVGDTVTVRSVAEQDSAPTFALQMNPRMSPLGTSVQVERWDPPSLLQLSVEYHSETGDWIVPSGHFLTPETATSTHYFLRGGQTVDPGNAEMTAGMKAATLHIFETEDIAMIEAQQRNLGTDELMARQPAILKGDAGGVRARRVLAMRMKNEAPSD